MVETQGTSKQLATRVGRRQTAWKSQDMPYPPGLRRSSAMHAHDEPVREIIAAVSRAFWNVPYPGDDRLLAEDCCDSHELERLQSQGWNSHWTNVPEEVIEWHADSLPFLSPEAFRFYLPAFIIYSLRTAESKAPVLPFLVYDLMNTAEGKRQCHQRRVALLSPEQTSAVLVFLIYVRDELKDPMSSREAGIAIESYWARAGAGRQGEESGTGPTE